jgi:formamidopyrimidine-DNA glycosylase (fpg)
MPELPEVETVVRELRAQILGKTFKTMTTTVPKMLKANLVLFNEQLANQQVTSLERFGKYILICFGNATVLRVHLRMEGKFYFTDEILPPETQKHIHIVVEFTTGEKLYYHDVRKFGTFELIIYQKDWYNDPKFATLGYEPWDKKCTVAFMQKQLKQTRGMIKPALLTQKNIVGLGNIYVDEVLFATKIHPETKAMNLGEQNLALIIKQSAKIMKKSIELGGTTIRTYHSTLGIDGMFQNELQVHLKAGQPCPKCSTIIDKIKVGGRGTYYCPQCQQI